MERLPETELMDDAEQAKAYAATDFSEPHNAFVQYFKERFPDFIKGNVLDLGCGPADIIIRFSKVFPDVHITGIDGSDAMLRIGRRDVEAAGLKSKIHLHNCLLPDQSLSQNKFEAVISNSLLHHLKDPFVLWDAVKHCIFDDSPVFIMDLFRPENPSTAQNLVNLHANGAPDILKKDFYNSLLAAYNIDEVKYQLLESGLDRLNTEVVSDRHFIVWGLK